MELNEILCAIRNPRIARIQLVVALTWFKEFAVYAAFCNS